MFRFISPVVVAAAIGALALAPGARAAPPAPEDLNPPPPDFLTCKPLGAGTICSGARVEVKESELQPELVCGSGADAFNIYDQGVIHQRATRWYDADGNLTRRIVREQWKPAFWSNPLSGKTIPYTQNNKITTVLEVPGDFDSAIETIVGENIYTDPATRRKVLRSTGRVVFGADGTLESRAGQQPFLDAFVDGDMSVFDAVCAALA
jgi:hypothetical protein